MAKINATIYCDQKSCFVETVDPKAEKTDKACEAAAEADCEIEIGDGAGKCTYVNCQRNETRTIHGNDRNWYFNRHHTFRRPYGWLDKNDFNPDQVWPRKSLSPQYLRKMSLEQTAFACIIQQFALGMHFLKHLDVGDDKGTKLAKALIIQSSEIILRSLLTCFHQSFPKND